MEQAEPGTFWLPMPLLIFLSVKLALLLQTNFCSETLCQNMKQVKIKLIKEEGQDKYE